MVYNKSSKVRWRCARSSTRLTFTTSPESSLPYHSYYCFASIVEEAKAHILIARSVSRSILNYTSCMMIVPIIVLLTYIQTDFSIFAYVANWKKFTYNLRMYTNLYNIYETHNNYVSTKIYQNLYIEWIFNDSRTEI